MKHMTKASQLYSFWISNIRVTAVIIAHKLTLIQQDLLVPILSMKNPMKKHPKISPKPKAIIAKVDLYYWTLSGPTTELETISTSTPE